MNLEPWMGLGPDYEAAHRGVAVVDRRERTFLRGTGKAVGEMLGGLLTSRIPGDPMPLASLLSGETGVRSSPPPTRPVETPRASPVQESALGSEAAYSLLLTPKGKMVSDLRILRDRDGSLLLDLPEAGFPGAREHFRKYLPPRLARVDLPSPDLALITLLGPGGSRLLSGLLKDPPPPGAEGWEKEGSTLLCHLDDGQEAIVVRSGDTLVPGLDLLVPALLREAILARFMAAGAIPLRPAVWATLVLEKGRPVFGVDMDEDTLPPEAGIQNRAIDNGKGCYTGQEVIIRIRDRGQVNKRLVGLLLGDAPPPERGTELFHSMREKSVGWLTRAAFSPRFGEGAALAYLRREVGVGESVRLGGPEGPPARVSALTDEGWDSDRSA